MKKIILASAIALVCGSPLAFAASNNASLNTQHCSYSDKGTSACRQDLHKNNVARIGDRVNGGGGGEVRGR